MNKYYQRFADALDVLAEEVEGLFEERIKARKEKEQSEAKEEENNVD